MDHGILRLTPDGLRISCLVIRGLEIQGESLSRDVNSAQKFEENVMSLINEA